MKVPLACLTMLCIIFLLLCYLGYESNARIMADQFYCLNYYLKRMSCSNLFQTQKKERIDEQYYVTTDKDEITKEIAEELLNDAEEFVLKMKLVIKNLNNDYIDEVRGKFEII